MLTISIAPNMDYIKTHFTILQNKTFECLNLNFNKHTWRSTCLF